MKVGSVTLLAFGGLIAVGSAIEPENENERNLVTFEEEEAAMEEEAPIDGEVIEEEEEDRELWMSKWEKKKYKQQMKKKKQARKKKAMLRKKKYKHKDPYYESDSSDKHSSKSDSSDKHSYKHDDYHWSGGGSTCVLTACISTYKKDDHNYRYKNMYKRYNGYHRNMGKKDSSSSSWSKDSNDDYEFDVSGKVTMMFDNYIGYRTHQPAPFDWYFDLKGLPPGEEGIVHLFEEEHCRAIHPTDRDGFYNYAVQVFQSPWKESIGYKPSSSGKAKGKYYIQNGWPCEAAIGRTAFVEIPGTDYYGCGVMMKGDFPCRDYKHKFDHW